MRIRQQLQRKLTEANVHIAKVFMEKCVVHAQTHVYSQK